MLKRHSQNRKLTGNDGKSWVAGAANAVAKGEVRRDAPGDGVPSGNGEIARELQLCRQEKALKGRLDVWVRDSDGRWQ